MKKFSVSCQEGFYRSGDMKTCQTCEAGKESNGAKTSCGEIDFQRAINSSICFLFLSQYPELSFGTTLV